MKLLEGLDVNKATGSDRISNWILKECRNQLGDKIHSLMKSSLEGSAKELEKGKYISNL